MLAAAHLEAAGYRILARGWRGAGREIDIVAEKGGVVAFVEVKTRAGRSLAPPAAAVDHRKRRQIAWAARAGAEHWRRVAQAFRFDVVSVTWGPDGPAVDHLEDVFRLGS
ncbi:MAG TPA: YraN family protein [Gemmatimonadota bacterium]|nr:YraN family protein [Gemmatimonadota bacterium]